MTYQSSLVSKAIFDLLEANKEELGILEVFDGDRQLIAVTPSVAVIAGDKTRELYGTSVMNKVNHSVVLMVYHKKIQTIEQNEREVQEFAEAIEAFLDRKANQTLGGLVVFGMVTRVEPGYANRDEKLMRTTRITWEAQSRHQMPTS